MQQSISNKPVHAIWLVSGILTFITMGFLALTFSLERTVFVDISLHLFYLLKTGNFVIQNDRIGAFITQAFPLTGQCLGLSLPIIAKLYSLSFVILPFCTFLLLHLVMKKPGLALCYLLYMALMTTHTFYWVQSELPQGMAFFMLFLGLFERGMNNDHQTVPAILAQSFLIFIACFTHPLILFPFLFTMLWYVYRYPAKRNYIGVIAFAYLCLFLFKVLFFRNPYDSQAMHGVSNIGVQLMRYFNLASHQHLMNYMVKDYYLFPILLVLTSGYVLAGKRWLPLILMLGFILGYMVLVNITYPNGGDQFYLENQYLILGFFVIFPFTKMVMPSLAGGGIVPIIICTAFLFRIYYAHEPYTKRLNWNKNFLNNTADRRDKKIVIQADSGLSAMHFQTWASAYEFWLLSTIMTGESRSVIIEEIPGEYDWALNTSSQFISKWGCFPYAELPHRYFNFGDSSHYVKISLR